MTLRLVPFVFLLLTACSSSTSKPRDAVLTGTINIADSKGHDILASTDPCSGSDKSGFNAFTNSATPVQLVPPTTGQNVYVCSIHVHGNFPVNMTELVSILDGGGLNCATNPKPLDGDLMPSIQIAGGGNGGFIQGGAGSTVYKTTGPGRGICAKAAGSNKVNFSGTFIQQ